MDWISPDEDSESELAAKKGREHEKRHLLRMRERYPGLVEIEYAAPAAPMLTLEAMRSGARMIYQGHLVMDGWQGYPDFLVRCDGAPCPCGGHHYNPWDTKLARSAKPYFLIQLCGYAELLEALGGFRPAVLGRCHQGRDRLPGHHGRAGELVRPTTYIIGWPTAFAEGAPSCSATPLTSTVLWAGRA